MGPGRSSIVQIQSEYQHDLQWSFQPIFNLMQILGIDLNVSQSRSKLRRLFFHILALLILIYNLTAIFIKHFTAKNSEAPNTTRFWVEFIRKNCTTISSVLMPMILVVATKSKWKPLWKKVHKMEHLMNLTNFLWHLRKIAIGTSAIVVFFVFLVK